MFAGECYARQVVTVVGSGVYLTRGTDVLSPLVGKGTGKGTSPGNVEHAISAIQSHFSELDTRSGALMRQGGIPVPAKNIFRSDSAWKADDAAWFKAHPDRSHRLRPMLEGETLPAEITKAEIPANHQLEILVPQVEPGARIRTVFAGMPTSRSLTRKRSSTPFSIPWPRLASAESSTRERSMSVQNNISPVARST